ncbi:hypothetical protein G6K83_11445, partial [Agrobacterium rhizogenes]|uniref:hypothetical protein n=1 Tax=Rhizobium rhizogenes TaxID=359 RepID=UPI001572FA35
KSVCPLWLADIRSDPCRKARPSAVSYTTPVDTIKLGLVYACRDRLTADFHAARLSMREIDELGLARFYQLAGVGKNFLNGKKYRSDIKPEIKAFISSLKDAARTQKAMISGDEGKPNDELANLRIANSRLRDIIHEAKIRLHAKRQMIKSLSTRPSPAVVPLSGKRTP